ncbi:hypothetical protein ACFQMA_10685 [Halosimplex aquaticum]|uniref:Uncharacterized protein n=1 Tax=Halosimplex aquaticum TaxID=3026162 RepID=A0ABD5Y358_9EURY|nr:hypothetical protein [Halosimplex aquaticum]
MPADARRFVLAPAVLALFALQIVSYAALLAVFSVHGEVAPVAAALRLLPVPVLVALSIPAIPAVVLSVALAEILRLATGVSPFDLGAVLLTPGDALVVLTAYLLAAGAVAARRTLFGPQTGASGPD